MHHVDCRMRRKDATFFFTFAGAQKSVGDVATTGVVCQRQGDKTNRQFQQIFFVGGGESNILKGNNFAFF